MEFCTCYFSYLYMFSPVNAVLKLVYVLPGVWYTRQAHKQNVFLFSLLNWSLVNTISKWCYKCLDAHPIVYPNCISHCMIFLILAFHTFVMFSMRLLTFLAKKGRHYVSVYSFSYFCTAGKRNVSPRLYDYFSSTIK